MRVLVIEDDEDIAIGIARSLRAEGFAVDQAPDLAEADVAVSVHTYDVIVADRMLPDGDGVDFVAAQRAKGLAVPVLFLTARDAVADRVEGFEAGGDDYVVKPFAMAELVVRVRAIARRGATETPTTLRVGSLEIDRARAEVRRDGVLLPLTSKERCVLGVLTERAGTAVSRSDLIEHCWDEAHDPMSNVVDVHVGSLRRKLGEPQPVRTVRGVGFLFDVES